MFPRLLYRLENVERRTGGAEIVSFPRDEAITFSNLSFNNLPTKRLIHSEGVSRCFPSKLPKSHLPLRETRRLI